MGQIKARNVSLNVVHLVLTFFLAFKVLEKGRLCSYNLFKVIKIAEAV